MNALEHLHQALCAKGETELLFHLELAIQQRDRLLWGVNSRSADLAERDNELKLLKERYNLLLQTNTQLRTINRDMATELKALKNEPS